MIQLVLQQQVLLDYLAIQEHMLLGVGSSPDSDQSGFHQVSGWFKHIFWFQCKPNPFQKA